MPEDLPHAHSLHTSPSGGSCTTKPLIRTTTTTMADIHLSKTNN